MIEDKQSQDSSKSISETFETAEVVGERSSIQQSNNPVGRLLTFLCSHWRVSLGVLVLLGFLLRLTGVFYRFDYPLGVDAGHFFAPALDMLTSGSLNPNNFYYGNLVHYILLVYFFVLKLFGATITNDPAYWFANVLSVIVGSATIFVAGLAGKEVFADQSEGKKAGLLTGLLVTILPYHIYRSTFVNGDVFGIFFTTLSLWFVARACKAEHDTKMFAYAGLFVGLAASAKYNYALFFLFVVLVYLFKTKFLFFKSLLHGKLRVHKGILLCAVLMVLAFVLTSPFAVLNYPTVAGILSFNSMHFRQGSHFAQNSYADGSAFTLPYGMNSYVMIPLVYLPIGLGVGLFVLFVLSCFGFVYLWRKRLLQHVFIKGALVFLALMYVYLAPNIVFHVRYVFPFFVLGMLLISAYLLMTKSRIVKGIALVCLLYTLVFSASISLSYLHSTRADVDTWLSSNVNDTAIVDGRTNPVRAENTLQLTDGGQSSLTVFKYWIKVDEIEQKKPDFIVMNSDYRDGFLMDSSLDPRGKTNLFLRRLFGGSAGYSLVYTASSAYFTESWYGYLRGEWGDTYKDESDESNYYVFRKV